MGVPYYQVTYSLTWPQANEGSSRGAKPLFFLKGGGWEKIDWGWGQYYRKVGKTIIDS
jgi:hypothetical protein